MMNSEEKEKALAAAIHARDLAKAMNLVEEHGCQTSGPGPWNQLPLHLAARSGNIEIVEYLLRKHAHPDDSTLLGAIESNMLPMVQYVSEELKIEWSEQHFDTAFTKSFAIRQYAFEVADDDAWFEPYFKHRNDENGDRKSRILGSARRSLIDISAEHAKALVEYLKRTSNVGVLCTVPDGDSALDWLHGFIDARNIAGFTVAWEAFHARYFNGNIHAALDWHSEGESVQKLCYSAIEQDCDEIFYFMLSYTLPNFDRCMELARNRKNQGILNYLSKRMQPG